MLARIIDEEQEYDRQGSPNQAERGALPKNKDKEKVTFAEGSSSNSGLDSRLQGLEEKILEFMGEGFVGLHWDYGTYEEKEKPNSEKDKANAEQEAGKENDNIENTEQEAERKNDEEGEEKEADDNAQQEDEKEKENSEADEQDKEDIDRGSIFRFRHCDVDLVSLPCAEALMKIRREKEVLHSNQLKVKPRIEKRMKVIQEAR
ncbi:hypothetical protein F2Q70_00040784 [Brassica cretica]|uniref:Uncharacterized protein n=1 Tax=Brassica cretica TaxID=69181 RepID=A0A8S9K5S1_BRACR|nr:hypothetical protein F2Q70_00040784 [Brassica cretica]